MIEDVGIVIELMEVLITGEPPDGFHMDDMPPALTAAASTMAGDATASR